MGPRILAVDDSKVLRKVIKEMLAPYDCDVTEATNGYNALFAVERERPDLILLDVAMPVMDGVYFLEQIKSVPAIRDIPVIMLTSPTDHKLIPTLPQLGAAGHVVKPFKPAALLELIGQHVTLKPLSKRVS
jgi:two-component system, chemotaxis family, chemotaxis protein CheY